MNRVELIGNLVRDPEIRYTTGQEQKAVCNMTIAVNDGYGERQQTSYIPIVVFGRRAENCEKYLAKGAKAAVTGRINTRSYTNKNNEKVYVTEIIADDVEFLSKPGGAGSGGRQAGGAGPAQQEPAPAQTEMSEGFREMQDDDIPF